MQRVNTQSKSDSKTNSAVTVTLPSAGPERRWRVRGIYAGVSGGSASLTVTGVEGDQLVAAVPASAPFAATCDVQGKADTPIVASLTAAGSGNIGYVTIIGALEQ